MKANRHIYILLAAIVPLAPACKRDIVPPALHCDRVMSEDDMRKCSVANYKYVGSRYYSPSVNPNNESEVVLIEEDVGVRRSLVKLDINSGTKTVLVDTLSALLNPDWGPNGWIVFSANWKIWKIREDGTGLQQISFDPRDIRARFSPSGDRVMFPRNMEYGGFELRRNPELRMDYKIMTIDLEGNPLDSFCRPVGDDPCYPWDAFAWSKDNKIAGQRGSSDEETGYGIAIYDLDGNEISFPYKVPDKKFNNFPFIEDIEWHPNNGLIYFHDSRGIKSLDPSNGRIKLLKKSCKDEFYEDFTITPDGDHIIAVKGEAWKDRSECEITTEMYLVKFKVNGFGEDRIEF